jgi:hypothetical protein
MHMRLRPFQHTAAYSAACQNNTSCTGTALRLFITGHMHAAALYKRLVHKPARSVQHNNSNPMCSQRQLAAFAAATMQCVWSQLYSTDTHRTNRAQRLSLRHFSSECISEALTRRENRCRCNPSDKQMQCRGTSGNCCCCCCSHALAPKVLGGLSCHHTDRRTGCAHLVAHVTCCLPTRVHTVPYTPAGPTLCADTHTRCHDEAGFAKAACVGFVRHTDASRPVVARGVCCPGGVAEQGASTEAWHLRDGVRQRGVDACVVLAGAAGRAGSCATSGVDGAACACVQGKAAARGRTGRSVPWQRARAAAV